MGKRYVVMAGVYTVKTFQTYNDAVTFALNWPDATRVVRRDDPGNFRKEWPIRRIS